MVTRSTRRAILVVKRALPVKLRRMRAAEVKLLWRLWSESGLPYKPKGRDSLASLKRQRLEDPELFVGAFKGKEMVGAAIASDDGRKGWINRLAVSPEARGQGIGSRLIRHCERTLRERGRRLLCVHIEDYNEESMSLFENHGYHREEGIYYYTKRERKDY